ncbi:type I pullulanase [Dokdonia pacifica]|uniref:Pullulanase n=2 Tax=Dokdonia pacifica TaxID=1627892 RepID=A0A239APZ1_9FLAO|nr:type I pullulanase [Dokdonia pacifica]SNR97776.1 pullulanase [Dokdonia pacifica]
MRRILFFSCILMSILSCKEQPKHIPEIYESYTDYKGPENKDLWLAYSKEATTFKMWSPVAAKVQVHLYKNGHDGKPYETYQLEPSTNSIWTKTLKGDYDGTYYTYQIHVDGAWLKETPGIYAKAVGVNGNRAMVLDLERTNPEGWATDKGPSLKSPNDAVIYELHIRDMTIHPQSGSTMPGKYLGLVENGTKGPNGEATGFDHMRDLGITHVHLLPTYDHYSIDETKLDTPQFNWGYDPQNYNVPEGSFSSDPYNAEVRIKEFKEMVLRFHESGIGVILDVVYNHTGMPNDKGDTNGSNFSLEFPGYYYRQNEDGSYANASACGNETASDREMMREFMVQSVKYWAEEYHLDGFRFDLMGIHDIETMNIITETLEEVNPNIFVYGEGWTAGDSPLPLEDRALKAHIQGMPAITAFSDDIRDGLKGSVFDDQSTGFVSGATATEESVKFGVVGSIQHPQIDYKAVNYSDDPWTNEPWQAISYVSCHDNHTLYDKLHVSRRDATEEAIIKMDKLANAIVLTSQGIPFIHAGAELLRTKNEEHNSYNLPDTINQIDWNRKTQHADVVNYYKNLIALRKAHPAFRMPTATEVRKNLTFKTQKEGLVSYQLSNHANGDTWATIYVIYNAQTKPYTYPLKGNWKTAVLGDDFKTTKTVSGTITVPDLSMVVLYQE